MSHAQPPATPAPEPLATGFSDAGRDAWLALVDKAIKGADFEKKMVSKTADGLRIEPIYTPADALPGTEGAWPGHAPFTRGTHAAPSGLGWDIRQFHTGRDAKSVNAAVLEDLAGGTTSIAIEIGGSNGLDLSADALKAALDGVLLDICPVTLIAHENTPAAAKALISVWEAQNLAPAKRRGGARLRSLGTLAVIRPAHQARRRGPGGRHRADRPDERYARRYGAGGRWPLLPLRRGHGSPGTRGDSGHPRRLPARRRQSWHRTRRSAAQDRRHASR